jgi:hypothetical protein
MCRHAPLPDSKLAAFGSWLTLVQGCNSFVIAAQSKEGLAFSQERLDVGGGTLEISADGVVKTRNTNVNSSTAMCKLRSLTLS